MGASGLKLLGYKVPNHPSWSASHHIYLNFLGWSVPNPFCTGASQGEEDGDPY